MLNKQRIIVPLILDMYGKNDATASPPPLAPLFQNAPAVKKRSEYRGHSLSFTLPQQVTYTLTGNLKKKKKI